MKKLLCLILALLLALPMAGAAKAAEDGDEDCVAVTVNVYSNLHGLEGLPGLVQGKNLYMSPDMLAYLTDGLPLQPTEE